MNPLISKTNGIALRKKKISTGYTLYLEYLHYGKRKKEFLKLHISAKNPLTQHDKNIIEIAEKLKLKKAISIATKNIDDPKIIKKPKTQYFFLYYEKILDQKKEIKNNSQKKWKHLYKHSKLMIKDIDKDWCEGFKKHLLSESSRNSTEAYFSAFKTVMKM
jgi:hypothetical protein